MEFASKNHRTHGRSAAPLPIDLLVWIWLKQWSLTTFDALLWSYYGAT